MFLDEGQIVGSIDHPSVVKVFEVGEAHGILFMVMEWVEGDSLHALIAEANKRRPIPPEVAVRMIADTAAGLHAAHELRGWDGKLKEIVHCDVSPHNILISLAGTVKLVDFGVAGAMNELSEDDEAKIRGKFGYMSPEQATAKPLDRRSDVFSLGIVLFELTTGYRLFRGRDDRHTLDLVSWGKIPRPSHVVSGYPPALEAIVMRALEREVDKRYQTADELRDALETYLVDERILVPSAGVKGILRKVLGSRIDQRRQQVRAAIRALDGGSMHAQLVSNESIVLDADDAISVSVSQVESGNDLSSPSGLGAARLPSDNTSGSGPHPVTQSAAPARDRKTSPTGFAIGALLGLGAAVALVLALRPSEAEPQVTEYGQPAGGATAAEEPNTNAPPPEPTPAAPTVHAVDIENLPTEPDNSALPPRGHGSPPTDPPTRRHPPGQRLERDMEALKPKQGSKVPEVTLTDDPVEEIAESVRLTEDSPKGNASGFDQGQALAALSRSASTASGLCRRVGGATGTGKATVTFSPNGSVQSVSLSAPFSGTPVGDCIASQMRRARVASFSGTPVVVRKSFLIPK